MLNVDNPSDSLRVRLKLYLKDQQEELLPIYHYEGMNLIE